MLEIKIIILKLGQRLILIKIMVMDSKVAELGTKWKSPTITQTSKLLQSKSNRKWLRASIRSGSTFTRIFLGLRSHKFKHLQPRRCFVSWLIVLEVARKRPTTTSFSKTGNLFRISSTESLTWSNSTRKSLNWSSTWSWAATTSNSFSKASLKTIWINSSKSRHNTSARKTSITSWNSFRRIGTFNRLPGHATLLSDMFLIKLGMTICCTLVVPDSRAKILTMMSNHKTLIFQGATEETPRDRELLEILRDLTLALKSKITSMFLRSSSLWSHLGRRMISLVTMIKT